MLDGITLLDTGTKVVSYTWGWSWGGFIAAIFAIFFIVVSIICMIDGTTGGEIFFFAGIFVGMLSLFIFVHAKPARTINTYSVIIDDSVSMTEFYDKYEVIDIQGKIFTITERKDTD